MGKYELTMDPVQEWGEEVEHGIVYGVTLRREAVAPPPNAAEDQPSASFVQYRTCKVRRVKAARLEGLVTQLFDPPPQDPDFVPIFFSMYRAFADPERLIKLLFQRADVGADANSSDKQHSLLGPLIHTWLQEYTDDLWEPPRHSTLQLLSSYLRPLLPFQHLAADADNLLKKFLRESTSEGTLLPEQENLEDEVVGDKSPECEDLGAFLDFPVGGVAEQLTRLDAELFVKVSPFQCLGCIWSQRDKKDNLCRTIRATIAQFNAVTNRVITSLLCCPATNSPGNRVPAPGPIQRARIVEKWIRIAQECRQLKNFSSLRAILSALQSNAIYRLKKTWAAVSRENVTTFENLCEMFPDENCVLGNGEIIEEDGTKSDAQNSSPKSSKRRLLSKQMSATGGSVPYLGTYLTVLTMLDTALPDTVEGGLINFEKRRKEFEILSQIRQLQTSCGQYLLPYHPQIALWLSQDQKLLTDQESYELSRDLEPPLDSCPESPSTWGSRLKKLSSLLSMSEGSSQKIVADQMSSSSSGSFSSEADDCNPSSLCQLEGLSSSCQDMAELFQSAPITPCEPTPQPASCFGSQPDLLVLTPCALAARRKPGHTSQHRRSVSMVSLPVYNRQVDDSCIVRVRVENSSNSIMYKSILLTSQDKTAQVIQRALEKHHLEGISCCEFTLSQVLPQDKELLIPDKANVFYAMSTSANYDFILRQQRSCQKKRPLGSSRSFRLLRGSQGSATAPGALGN
ncbi:ral guanine nucleotide dissociation stimulator-like 1 isoform X2 [Brienomyrus brachyistius]|uniref:ral guanine nucleotide dissociation stimulator-like 1 isoform X2 n=1 Tax=Brienomyrus brachyistius TaxID=42636 RepID=UPI0020B449FF|nr:ral guanine nucleotide dissociation stimulator-like 1 isoform X2 [Brienomyrus brachyistius]